MAGTLIGEIVNSCDATTGFSAGSISGDDDFAEGTGALGAKVSNTFTAFYTTSLGATAPYSFASGGGEFGWHMIMWFSSKSKLNATSGYRLIVGNGTSRGEWDVPPLTSELKRNGAFVSRVIDLARDFSRIAAGSWTTTGNPAQLSNLTQMGGGLQTTVSIMGSFNNAQIDQITIGLGIRLSGGTIGTPDTFETARAADEDVGIWGWSQDRTLKGGIYIGPETGSAASVFNSQGETRNFAASPVAVGFFRIEARGAGTDVTINGLNLSAVDASVARWDYNVGSTTNTWEDEASVYSGIGVMRLESFANLTNIKITDITSILQNGADVVDSQFLEPNTAANDVLMDVTDISKVINNTFASGGTGHAVDLGTIASSTSITWNNKESGYVAGVTGSPITAGTSGNETILCDVASGQTLTINVADGASTPSVKNDGAGSVNVVAGQKQIVFTPVFEGGAPANYEWRLYEASVTPGTIGTVEIDGAESSTAATITYSYSYTADQDVVLQIIATGFEEARFDATAVNADQGFDVPVSAEDNI